MKMKLPKDKPLAYKIGAIILACLLWLYVNQTQSPISEQIYTVPVEERNLAQGLVVSGEDYQVQVRVQGNSSDLEAISSADIKSYIDLAGFSAGTTTVTVNTLLPDTLELISLDPNSVTVNIEEIKTKAMPLEINVEGAPADGYMSLEPVISATQVIVSGAQDDLDQISKAYVNASIIGLKNAYSAKLPVQLKDASGQDITSLFAINPSIVDVYIPIMSEQPEKNVAVDVPVLGEPAQGYQLSRILVQPSTVNVFGSLSDLQKLYYVQTLPVDITGMKKSLTQNLELVLDDRFTTENVDKVQVVLGIEPVITKVLSKILIQQVNVPQQMAATLPADNGVIIEVSGPQSFVDNISEADITAYVDCANLKAGSYTLPIQFHLPTSISIVSTTPTEVLVNINRAP